MADRELDLTGMLSGQGESLLPVVPAADDGDLASDLRAAMGMVEAAGSPGLQPPIHISPSEAAAMTVLEAEHYLRRPETA